MRGFLASSIGVTCAAALALPLTLPASAAPSAAPAPAPATHSTSGARSASTTAEPALPGSTQSLPLAPRTSDRTFGAAPEQGLTRGDVHRFSLVGVIWDDPDTALRGSVQVRTRATATGTWSGWQDVDTHNDDHGADPGTAERASGHVRGSTAPLWVGDSDGVDVRVRSDRAAKRTVGKPDEQPAQLPTGLHLELVDPGAADPRSRARRRPGTEPPPPPRPPPNSRP